MPTTTMQTTESETPTSRVATSPPIAAVSYKDGESIDRNLLAAFADDLLARGVIVRGLVDSAEPGKGSCGSALRDLETGQLYAIFQDLGPGSTGCSIDPGAVLSTSCVLDRAVAGGAELVVANRFGKLEATGGGLAASMLAVMSADIPFITLVADAWLPQWRSFTGGLSEVLKPDRECLDEWVARHVPSGAR